MPQRKPPGQPATMFDPRDWVPLRTEAFARIKAAVGGAALAVRDLLAGLRDGTLGSATRAISYDRTEEVFEILPPSFWSDVTIDTEAGSEGQRACVYPPKGRRFTGIRYFFIRRSDLDRAYPPAGTPKGASVSENPRPQYDRGRQAMLAVYSPDGKAPRGLPMKTIWGAIDAHLKGVKTPSEDILAEVVKDLGRADE
jgi:hypothetical protein